MVEILLYAFGIMYTPGPVNLLSLNGGLNGLTSQGWRFCAGVGCAMFLLFVVFGYTGAWLASPSWQLPLSLAGCSWITWLAFKVGRSGWRSASIEAESTVQPVAYLPDFKGGFLMQLLNPKAPLAILPIATVQFPAAGIESTAILGWSLVLGLMAGGAPTSYLLLGARLGHLIQNPLVFRYLNLLMALLLLYVAGEIAVDSLPD